MVPHHFEHVLFSVCVCVCMRACMHALTPSLNGRVHEETEQREKSENVKEHGHTKKILNSITVTRTANAQMAHIQLQNYKKLC